MAQNLALCVYVQLTIASTELPNARDTFVVYSMSPVTTFISR